MLAVSIFSENLAGQFAGSGPVDPTNFLQEMLVSFIEILIGMAGALCLFMIVYAGFRMITSFGSEDVFKASIKRIWHALFGLAIAMLAYALVQFVMKAPGEIINANNIKGTQSLDASNPGAGNVDDLPPGEESPEDINDGEAETSQ